MSTTVELNDLTRRYASVYALRDFSLAIAAGEFVTLLGPSGSGKSSVLRLIAGFDTPTSGDIRVGGRSVLAVPSHERNIGMVFQNYALFPHMTVFENVAFPLRVRDVDSARVTTKTHEALAMTRLEAFVDRYPRELSGGQQQRVALARAIVFGPEVLLMDEPLGALDRNLRDQLKFEIKRIHRELKMTVLFVTHDQDEALVMSDRVIVMRDGRLEQDATPTQIYAKPDNRFVATFMGESNLIPCRSEGGRLNCRRQELPGNGGFPGRDVWLLVRPETIRIATTREPECSIPAEVIETIFLGEATRYVLSAFGERIVVKEQNRGTRFLSPGSAVFIGWKPDLAVVLDS